MEQYFQKPALARAFYYKNAKDFTCYHQHDVQLTITRKNIIYLYRDPVETIYSQLQYQQQDINNLDHIKSWSMSYRNHLKKWLFDEDFTTVKTIITYEEMKSNMESVIKKICAHLNMEFNSDQLKPVLQKVSKEKLKKKTTHDQQVVNLDNDYNDIRKIFREKYGSIIYKTVCFNEELKNQFLPK
ncbi:MAG: sulfotransferase [Spirochaetes bacterium]|nr:sulfotransferase [Spirochaetota bacterium]